MAYTVFEIIPGSKKFVGVYVNKENAIEATKDGNYIGFMEEDGDNVDIVLIDRKTGQSYQFAIEPGGNEDDALFFIPNVF